MIKKIILLILFCFTILNSGDGLLDSTTKYLPKERFSQITHIDKLPDWCANYKPKGNIILIDSIRAIEQIDKSGKQHIQIVTVTYYGSYREYRLFFWYLFHDSIWIMEKYPIITKTKIKDGYYICW
jgi:hypothetical protein